MHQNNKSDNVPHRRNGAPEPQKRIDANPPYGPEAANPIEQFRRMLAELIARKLIAERRDQPPGVAGE
jgi:hypothetical protein